MGSTCSKNNYSRSSSRKMLCDNTMPIANLDETIGQENYGMQSNTSRSTNVASQAKPSTKEQLLDFSLVFIRSYSTGSTGTVVDSFQTKTLKMNCPISDLVKLPPGVNEYIWIYEKAQFYLEECQLLWESISDFCNPYTCPEMAAGPHYTYLWTDEHQRDPISMPACNYISNVFIWASNVFSSDDFAEVSDGVFPENFIPVMRILFKKLFRVYAHVYHHHLSEFIKRNAEIHLNTSFKYFGMFVREFGLISKKEEAPLRKLLEQLIDSESHSDASPVDTS
ncbi:hypothetical protein WA171_006089 [Blastocystis sp. BT1]